MQTEQVKRILPLIENRSDVLPQIAIPNKRFCSIASERIEQTENYNLEGLELREPKVLLPRF